MSGTEHRAEAGEHRPPTLEALVEAIDLAKELLAELRSEAKAARAARRELDEARTSLLADVAKALDEGIGEEVRAALERYNAVLEPAIAKHDAAITKRFDDFTAILLGEDAKSRRRGKPSLGDFAARIGASHGERIGHLEEAVADLIKRVPK